MEFKHMVENALNKVIASGKVEAALEDNITKAIERTLKESLGTFSPVSDELSKVFKERIGIDTSVLPFEQYNDTVLKLVKQQVDRYIREDLVGDLNKRIENFLKRAKNKVKLSELLEVFTNEIELEYGEEPRTVSLHEDSSYGGMWLYLDEEEDQEKYQCKYKLYITDCVIKSIYINGKEITDSILLGRLYGFENFVLRCFLSGAVIEDDVQGNLDHFSHVSPPGEDY